MIKIEKYDGSKTYMFPNGELATPERVKKDYPAVEAFTHIVKQLSKLKILETLPLPIQKCQQKKE